MHARACAYRSLGSDSCRLLIRVRNPRRRHGELSIPNIARFRGVPGFEPAGSRGAGPLGTTRRTRGKAQPFEFHLSLCAFMLSFSTVELNFGLVCRVSAPALLPPSKPSGVGEGRIGTAPLSGGSCTLRPSSNEIIMAICMWKQTPQSECSKESEAEML